MLEVSRSSSGSIRIGEVSRRTGVDRRTLRTWEVRHGFPVARAAESTGDYALEDVEAILEVVRAQNEGQRLDEAIAKVIAARWKAAEPVQPSTYAELVERHPQLTKYRLTKSSLIALSWAIEDEFCAVADQPILFASFQRRRFFESARPRWEALAHGARAAFVFVDDGSDLVPPGRPHDETSPLVTVALPEGAPMLQEWDVICDAPDRTVVLTAWELPGQEDVRDRDRMFEAVWTIDPVATRDAARVCARIAADHGAPQAAPVQFALADEPPSGTVDIAAAADLCARIVAYLDRHGRS